MKIGKWIGKGIAFLIVGALLAYLFVLATQLLWNWLVPALFAGPVITFWQAAGLLLLAKLMFGFGGKHHRGGSWKHNWTERYKRMSPEDRERLKEKMKQKWCSWEDSKKEQKWTSWESTGPASTPKQPEPGA